MKINGDLILKQSLTGSETDYAPSVKVVKDTFDIMGLNCGYYGARVINFNEFKKPGVYSLDVNNSYSNTPTNFNPNEFSFLLVFKAESNRIVQFLSQKSNYLYFRVCIWGNWDGWNEIPMTAKSPYLQTCKTHGYKGILTTPEVFNLNWPFTNYLCVFSTVSNSSLTSQSIAIVGTGAMQAGKTGNIQWITNAPTGITVTLGGYDGTLGGMPLTVSSTNYCAISIAAIY